MRSEERTQHQMSHHIVMSSNSFPWYLIVLCAIDKHENDQIWNPKYLDFDFLNLEQRYRVWGDADVHH